jgi:hypothetical protein
LTVGQGGDLNGYRRGHFELFVLPSLFSMKIDYWLEGYGGIYVMPFPPPMMM